MKKVYESSTALEAHMVKNLLENEGITSRIDGEYLQGGVGDLQAIGVIRLLVEEADYTEAKKTIDQWEASQPPPEEVTVTKTSSATSGFVLGVAVTLGIVFWIFNSPVTEGGIDYNSDGVLDEVWIYKNGRLQQTLVDRNLDGIKDAIYDYNNKELLTSIKLDEDFDGNFETKIKYKDGNAVRAEADTNNDGIIDHRTNYTSGVTETIEMLDDKTGKVIKRQYYRLNKLIADDYDTNGDGVLNSHYEYNQYEEKK